MNEIEKHENIFIFSFLFSLHIHSQTHIRFSLTLTGLSNRRYFHFIRQFCVKMWHSLFNGCECIMPYDMLVYCMCVSLWVETTINYEEKKYIKVALHHTINMLHSSNIINTHRHRHITFSHIGKSMLLIEFLLNWNCPNYCGFGYC